MGLFKKKKAAEAVESAVQETGAAKDVQKVQFGEELAAIAMALYQYSEDLHDIENTIITINRQATFYSPWSSKIYGLRQIPNRR